jgi:hypothetical protein
LIGLGVCGLDVHLVEAGTASDERIEGVSDTAIAYDGDNFVACSYFDGCSIRAAFSASR